MVGFCAEAGEGAEAEEDADEEEEVVEESGGEGVARGGGGDGVGDCGWRGAEGGEVRQRC